MILHEGSLPPQCTVESEHFDAVREGYYRCFTRRADTLFELADAPLCAPGKVADLTHLSLKLEHHSDYGALYHAINH